MDKFKYWLFESYRRKILDNDLFSAKKYFKGKILDIGAGRERGVFQNFRGKNWTIVDIEKTLKPDIVATVENLPIKNNSHNVIKATDLFGYVEDLDKGFSECSRVLKPNGYLILSIPYLTAYDSEQHDSQLLTEYRLRKKLKDYNFKIIKFKSQGYFFSVWADFTREWIHHTFLPLRYLSYLTVYPILDLLVLWESKTKINKFWQRYTTGFFVIAQKKN